MKLAERINQLAKLRVIVISTSLDKSRNSPKGYIIAKYNQAAEFISEDSTPFICYKDIDLPKFNIHYSILTKEIGKTNADLAIANNPQSERINGEYIELENHNIYDFKDLRIYYFFLPSRIYLENNLS